MPGPVLSTMGGDTDEDAGDRLLCPIDTRHTTWVSLVSILREDSCIFVIK
jgi:hypothetical protein